MKDHKLQTLKIDLDIAHLTRCYVCKHMSSIEGLSNPIRNCGAFVHCALQPSKMIVANTDDCTMFELSENEPITDPPK